MENILPTSLELNFFTPNTLGCYRLREIGRIFLKCVILRFEKYLNYYTSGF